MSATERAVLAGGCFWGMQHLLAGREGIVATRVGYTGGATPDPTEDDPGAHAEAVEIVFDPARVSYRELLQLFFQIHDPTTLNRQGDEEGTYVRSAIFSVSDEQRRVAEETITDVDASGLWPGKVVTAIEPAGRFWEAPADDQHYFERHREGESCHFVRPGWRLPERTARSG